ALSFYSQHPPPPPPSTLSLHDALPIFDLTIAFANPGSTQTPGCIKIWNGTITSVAYGVADPAGKRSVIVTFTTSNPTVLLAWGRSEEHTSELQSRGHLVCRLLLEKKKK